MGSLTITLTPDRENQCVPCYNNAMRAIILLLTGAFILPNTDGGGALASDPVRLAGVTVEYAKVKKGPGVRPRNLLRRQRCLIETDGKVHYRGACELAEWDDTETGFSSVGREPPFLAQLLTEDDQFSVWNGPHRGGHLHDYLGVVKRQGPCWITITRPPQAPKEDDWKYRPRSKVCAR